MIVWRIVFTVVLVAIGHAHSRASSFRSKILLSEAQNACCRIRRFRARDRLRSARGWRPSAILRSGRQVAGGRGAEEPGEVLVLCARRIGQAARRAGKRRPGDRREKSPGPDDARRAGAAGFRARGVPQRLHRRAVDPADLRAQQGRGAGSEDQAADRGGRPCRAALGISLRRRRHARLRQPDAPHRALSRDGGRRRPDGRQGTAAHPRHDRRSLDQRMAEAQRRQGARPHQQGHRCAPARRQGRFPVGPRRDRQET